MVETAWISVGQLGEGFEAAAGSHCLPASPALAGKRLTLHWEDGSSAEYHFRTAAELVRTTPGIVRASQPQTYRASEIRPGIFFVDLLDGARSTCASSLVLELGRGICTVLEGLLPSEAEARVPLIDRIARGEELTGVGAAFLSGAVGRPFDSTTARHAPTRELIGKRVEYTYSDSERYEHLYLNESLYTWHCLAGSERGLADTDRCRYLKVGDRLYFFVWREKVVPTLGAVLVDLEQMRTTGKIFGYRGSDFGAVANFPVGARARVAASS